MSGMLYRTMTTRCIFCGKKLNYFECFNQLGYIKIRRHLTEEEKKAMIITGGLETTSKMPCKSFSIPSTMCHIGSIMKNIKGSTCEHCYTFRYGRYAHVLAKQYERIGKMIDPEWVDAMVVLIKGEKNDVFRWHGSGDLMSVRHLENIVKVCQKTPEVNHWLPTLEADILRRYVDRHGKLDKIPNLVVRLSTPMLEGRPNYMLAKKYGVSLSRVTKKYNKKNIASMNLQEMHNLRLCVASKQDGHCNDCRKCWSREHQVISYVYH